MKRMNRPPLILVVTFLVGFFVGFMTMPGFARETKKERTGVKKFVIYNHHGQTAGSFISHLLQKSGIPCADEVFNKNKITRSRTFLKVFRYKKYIESEKPGSIDEAFKILQKCEPLSDKYLGLKICSTQRKSASDFEEMLADEDIVKIFLYRQNEIKFYLTRFLYWKMKKQRGEMKRFMSFSYDPTPFHYYEVIKPKCKGTIIEVECEDFFDFRVNTATKFCQFFGLDDNKVKYLALKGIEKCKIKPLTQILTKSEIVEMKNFFNIKYSMEELARMEFKDCREIHPNLGFL